MAVPVKKYRRKPWLNPKVEIGESGIHGKGMFANDSFAKGEIVAIWGGEYVSKRDADQAKKKNPGLRLQQIDDDVFEVFTKKDAEDDPTYFQNHSCDPNTWMADDVTISAMRNIMAGEELTIDYAMFEANERQVITENCACGSSRCRRRVNGEDWRISELQRRYANHFSPMINRFIIKSKSKSS
jgi:uncharacterized protein